MIRNEPDAERPTIRTGPWGLWLTPAAPWAAAVLAIVGAVSVTLFVDVSPRVEGEFFFADDDPQMVASETVRERFPAGAQVVLRVTDERNDPAAYRDEIAAMTDELHDVPGVRSVYSIATHDPDSPLFGRVLGTRDANATNVVLDVDAADPRALLPPIEAVADAHGSDGLDIVISGVPAIVEMIRRSLDRDLIVFSTAAIVVFALLIGAVYRDAAVLLGTLSTCFVAVTATLLTVRAVGVPIGLLTANLVTIVFVLTLSHVVFLTANWSRALAEGADRAGAVAGGVRRTLEPSFWSMATTLLGFLSLLIATARPLRELGVAGAIGTVTALLSAFLVYPAFLGRWASPGAGGVAEAARRRLAGRWPPLLAAGAVVAFCALGVARVDTDPTLLSYFDRDSEIRRGIEEIDADGGTSTLDVVVRDPGGRTVGEPPVFAAMQQLQQAMDDDPSVGVVLSPAVLIAQARTLPFAGLLPPPVLFDLATSEQLGGVGLGFVTPDRAQARFSLRMRESLGDDRDEVIDRIEGLVDEAGLEPVVVAGLYDLQAQLGRLIRESLKIGIGGLLLLFLGVAYVVSRSIGVTLRMWACLVAIPTVILGTFGHLGIAIDIITSPSANISLAIGADAMIHLVVRARTLRAVGEPQPWAAAVAQIRGPVFAATGIVCAGFGIFALSSFPPTRRFGLAVILGTAAAATMAVAVLPRLGKEGSGAVA